jgi:hypothetical protein
MDDELELTREAAASLKQFLHELSRSLEEKGVYMYSYQSLALYNQKDDSLAGRAFNVNVTSIDDYVVLMENMYDYFVAQSHQSPDEVTAVRYKTMAGAIFSCQQILTAPDEMMMRVNQRVMDKFTPESGAVN